MCTNSKNRDMLLAQYMMLALPCQVSAFQWIFPSLDLICLLPCQHEDSVLFWSKTNHVNTPRSRCLACSSGPEPWPSRPCCHTSTLGRPAVSPSKHLLPAHPCFDACCSNCYCRTSRTRPRSFPNRSCCHRSDPPTNFLSSPARFQLHS